MSKWRDWAPIIVREGEGPLDDDYIVIRPRIILLCALIAGAIVTLWSLLS